MIQEWGLRGNLWKDFLLFQKELLEDVSPLFLGVLVSVRGWNCYSHFVTMRRHVNMVRRG